MAVSLYLNLRGHGGRVVTLSPPTSEVRVRFQALPQVGKMVVACRRSAVYSTEPWPTVCTGFLCPSNYLSWYDLCWKWHKTPNTFVSAHIWFLLDDTHPNGSEQGKTLKNEPPHIPFHLLPSPRQRVYCSTNSWEVMGGFSNM